MKIKLIVFFITFSILPAVCMAEDVVVIANKSVTETTLSKQDLSNIYLGKKSIWNDGGRIRYVVSEGSSLEAFLKEYVGKTESQFNTFWKKQIFTGKGKPPQRFASDEAMIEYVAKAPGALGYVSAGADVSKVKIITIK